MTPIPVQDPAASQALQETYGLVGRVPLSVDETIVPVAIVNTLELGNVRKAFGTADEPGVPAQFSHIQLLNPSGSGVLLFIEKVLATLEVAGDVFVSEHDPALTGDPGSEGWRDRRRGGAPIGTLHIQNLAAAVGTVRLVIPIKTTGQFFQIDLGATLLPGNGILIRTRTVDINLDSSWYWSERNLLPSE